MKKCLILLMTSVVLSLPSVSFGQTSKEKIKERQELMKASRKEFNEKASKDARKDAKKFIKEGWKTAPGALPLEKQLDRSYIMQSQFDDDGFPKYIMAEAISNGGNYDAAKMQAIELAKQGLATKLESEIAGLIENDVANAQMDESEAASLTKTVAASKSKIANSLGRIITVVEAYRETKGNNREVLVRVAYSQDMARAAAKRVVRKQLEEEGNQLHEKLDEIINW